MSDSPTIDWRIEHLLDRTEQLQVHVVDGNGKPGLLTRVTELEALRHGDRTVMTKLSSQVEMLGLDMRESQKEMSDQIDGNKHDLVGALHALETRITTKMASDDHDKGEQRNAMLIAILSAVAALIAALLPLFFSKG